MSFGQTKAVLNSESPSLQTLSQADDIIDKYSQWVF